MNNEKVKINADDRLLCTKQLAKYLAVSTQTLEIWRCNGEGPPYMKVGRLVRYRLSEVNEWLSERNCRSTSENCAEVK